MRIAMIGIKAIPARFGGFETAVDELSRGLVRGGHAVVVYNRRGMSSASTPHYDGVRLVTLPTLPSKNLSTICHSLLATVHAMFGSSDIVHYFTTGATLFAPLVRMMGKKVICSVDGTDWQRAKWGPIARWYLKASERYAAAMCDALVSDSGEVEAYYRNKYNASSFRITYGVRRQKSANNDVLTRFGMRQREYLLFVGRLVPENNVHHLIAAFEKSRTEKKLVIVGDDPWEKEYVSVLRSTRDPRVVFTGGIYGDGYAQLQQNAYAFILPDEVGGTHPALVEAMGFGNCVLVNDTPSNLEVIGDAGLSYSGNLGTDDLAIKLQILLDDPGLVERYRQRAQARAQKRYQWAKVVEQHTSMYEYVLRRNTSARGAAVPEPADS